MEFQALFDFLAMDFPKQIWFVPPLVLLLLGFLSFYDAWTGRIPDLPLVGGLFGVFGSLAWYAGWYEAGERLVIVLVTVFVIKAVNEVYAKFEGHDAIGFGDAKWTGLAVSGFGVGPLVITWFVAAWLGLIWMGIKKIIRRYSDSYEGHDYVHFAPFLFLGLCVALVKKIYYPDLFQTTSFFY